MGLIDVSIFSKEDRITRCHPLGRCFYLCPKVSCEVFWHMYNISKEAPLPDSMIPDHDTFSMLYKKNLEKLANFDANMAERIE